MVRDTCCTQTTEPRAPICPLTGRATLPVARATVLGHVREAAPPTTSFGFCDVPTCSVVYVGADGTLIAKEALKTRVGVKETEDPIRVCSCWGFTVRDIIDDLARHGRSTVRAFIIDRVRLGRCSCERTNPSGRCCLGEVGRALTLRG